MGDFPTGFLLLMLGIVAAAVVLVLIAFAWRQHKLHQLLSSQRDYAYHHRRG